MTDVPDLTRLRGELDLREVAVPAALDDALAQAATFQISRDAFLLTLPNGLAFHYRRGAGTAYRRTPEVTDDEVALFFEGSVFGAIAWLNGFVPLHASAVWHDGEIYAFTGVSGEGKSTLASALALRGMPLCSDDVLVLDLDDPARVFALPGPARMKLWGDALALTGRASTHAVRPGIDKYYIRDVAFVELAPYPLRRLYFLESDPEAATGIVKVEGAESFNWMRSAYYRSRFFRTLVGQDTYFKATMRLGRSVEMARFNRSRDRALFETGVDAIAADIRGGA